MTEGGLCVVLMGGGRWGRVHACVLQSLHPRMERLVWVSSHNRRALARDYGALSPRVEIVDSLDEALRHRPDAAVICTTSANHAQDASIVLGHGIPSLVEKPLAMDMASATELVALAARRRLALFVCLPLLMASYLRWFKAACGGRGIGLLRLHWFDPATEWRDGDVKHTDITTHGVDEILPHLWSIIAILIGTRDADILSVASGRPEEIILTLDCGGTRVEGSFGRRAAARVRRIELSFVDGGFAELDFAQEPGLAIIDGRSNPDGGSWETELRPLAAVHTAFLDQLSDASAAMQSPIAAGRCVNTVRLAQDIRPRVATLEARRAAKLLKSGQSIDGESEWLHLILDNLGPELAQLGARLVSSDEQAHRQFADAARLEVFRRAGMAVSSATTAPAEYKAALAASPFLGQVFEHFGKMA
jgi:predicted dehydrogenase